MPQKLPGVPLQRMIGSASRSEKESESILGKSTES